MDFETELRSTFSELSVLDCVIAFASCAVDLNYVRPQVVPAVENCIQIVNGRHPLQEIVLENEYIPNSTCIDVTNRVNIITGPNFSGKSCYARQVGLLTYMAHIGSFLPCDEARISIIDTLLVRFSAIESCAVPQSSFQLALTQMGSILRRTEPNALIVSEDQLIPLRAARKTDSFVSSE
jgi:DNA mismatch repair ATPase MutS